MGAGRQAGHGGAGRLALALATLVATLIGTAAFAAPEALAASGSITITADDPPPPAQPSGSDSTYSINFTCSSVGETTCGANPTITIPLDTSTEPPMPLWDISASSNIPGLILRAEVVGGQYVITLDPALFRPGDSDTITLSVRPPNNITPDGTRWELQPTLRTDALPATTAPRPAPGEADARTHLSVSKATNDGGAVYVKGTQVIYNITARCNAGGATGNLDLTSGSLVDTLPPGLRYVSATPAPTTAPPVGSGGTITWDYPDSASLPAGCSRDGRGTTSYQIVAEIDPSVPNNTSLVNEVEFSGLPIGETTEQRTNARRPVTVVDVSPPDPGIFASKTSAAPLEIPDLGYFGTFPGDWIPGTDPTPSLNPGAAEGRYTITIRYPASGAYETNLDDPMPCLDNGSGVVYSSSDVIPPATRFDTPVIADLCRRPAFHPTVVQVSAASLATAVAAGWRPTGIRTDGTGFPLVLVGSGAGSSSHFTVPAGEVGNVAAITLQRDRAIRDPSVTMSIWGYADASLRGGDVLHDIVSATAFPTSGVPDAPITFDESADIYIEPDLPQLGVHKAFGTLGAGPGGTTAIDLVGNVAALGTLPGDVVLTDLLPAGLRWSNPTGTVNYTLTSNAGGTSRSIAGTVEYIQNFQSTGRNLIRVSFPAPAFTAGFYTLTPPADFILINVPAAATTYNNTGQLFVRGIDQETSPVCGPGTTSTPAQFESSDPLDLDGDGDQRQNYCSWTDALTVPPSGGPSFGLVKSVEGDQDPVEKFAPGIGNASEGGTATYTLRWSNTGGESLTDAVVYEILPFVGDTGVSQGESGTPRDSEFAPLFTGIVGSLPAGVTVQYSRSTNPCRDEVYPDAANRGCVNDWTSTAPLLPATVRALRFTGAGPYAPASSFAVSFGVRVPPDTVNVVAWNSAASAAEFNGSPLLPAEPPKVGLTSPAEPRTPTIETAVSSASVTPGTPVHDTVTIGNTGGGRGEIAWELHGPLPPAPDGGCAGLDWSGSPLLASGTIPVLDDGDYDTPAAAPRGAGCYGWTATIDGDDFSGPVTSPLGASGELFLVRPATISTAASALRIAPGGTVTDVVDLSGTGGGRGTLAWSLIGPIAPAADGTCAGLGWSGAATTDSGRLPIDGDGRYETPATGLTAGGCYSYVQRLTGDSPGGPSASLAGTPGETVFVGRPTVATTISAPSVLTGGTLSDRIVVGGTGGGQGQLTWQLLGPVAPGADGRCESADWSGAAVVAQGTIAVPGDGAYTTPVATVSKPGCHGYAVTLYGADYGGPVVSPAGAPGEVALVSEPVVPPARVTIVKRVDHAAIEAGDQLRYTLIVTNRGPGDASGVVVTDTPQTPMSLVRARPSQGRCSRRFPLRCALGTVRAGRRATIVVVATPRAAGLAVNHAQVTTRTPNTAPAGGVEAATRSRVLIPLRLSKRASAARVPKGGRVAFTIALVNPSGLTARSVRICDRMPSGLAFAGASVRTTVRNGARCWTVASLGPRQTKRYRITARALRCDGSQVNRVALGARNVRPRQAHAAVTVTNCVRFTG